MKVLCRFMILAAAALPASAQQRDTAQLGQIVVTATRLPMTLDRVTAAVTVLKGEDLRAAGIRFVADALRQVPGAAVVQTGAFGGTTSLFLRGGESDYVRVLLDGVPVNRPGGSFDFAGLTTDNVDRIEIVRGPGSVLYGSDAVTGVVNIISRAPAGAEAGVVRAEARAGTYGSWGAGLESRGGTPRLGYTMSVSRFSSAGLYPINNAYRNAAVSALVQVQPDASTDARLSVRHSDGVFHYPTDGAGRIADANQFQTEAVTTASVDAGRYLAPGREVRVLLAAHHVRTAIEDSPDQLNPFEFDSRESVDRRTGDLRVNAYFPRATVLTVGAVMEDGRERTSNTFAAETLLTRGSWAAYVQAVTQLGGLAVNAGLRRERNERFGAFTTTRLGAAYRLATGTRVRATYATGFKEPTFFENYAAGFVTGNPDLRPERSRSVEVGVEQAAWRDRVTLAGTYFDQRFRDLIEFTFAPPSAGDPNYFNVAGAVARGVEFEARAELGGVSATAQYTWLETEAVDTALDGGPDGQFALGQRLLRRPTHSGGLTLAYHWDVVRLHAALAYVGDRAELDFAGFPASRAVLPAYTRADLGVEVEVIRGAPGFTGTVRIENLFDRRYQEVLHFPARGRVVFVGGTVSTGF